MEETDPAQVLSGRKHVVETSTPGSAPMAPPMGMPMSPHSQANGEPTQPLAGDDRMYALDTPATEFGSPAVTLTQGHVLADAPGAPLFQQAGAAEPAMRHGALLEPVHQGIPAEQPHILPVTDQPHILPVDDCCSCCGNSHDGQETRHFDREATDRDHSGHNRHDNHDRHDHDSDSHDSDGHGRHDHDSDGHGRHERHHDSDRHNNDDESTADSSADGDSSTHDPCACCGEDHPGLDSLTHDGKPGDPNTPTSPTDENTEEDSDEHGDSHHDDDSEDPDEHDDSHHDDGDDSDESDDGHHGDGDDSDEHGSDHGGKPDESDDCPADRDDHHGQDDRHGQDDHHGQNGSNANDPSEPGLPPTAPVTNGKVPLTPQSGGQPQDPLTHPQGVAGKPLTPTESVPKGQAVAQEAAPQLPNTPRGTMAPPTSQRLGPRSPEGGSPKTPGKEPIFSKSAPPPATSGGAPQSKLTPQQSAIIPTTPGMPVAPVGQGNGAPQTGGGESPPLQSGVHAAMPPATVTPPPTQAAVTTEQPPATVTAPPAAGSAPTMPPPAYTSEKPPAYQPANAPASTQPASFTPGTQPGTTTPVTNFAGGTTPGAAPPTGNVGPDPNIKFDEAQYTQLIGVIGEVGRTLKKATSIDVVYLDAELHLQPTGQTWEPAVNLVTRGGRFGGSIDTESTTLGKSLSTFHTALEQAKEVFKETDDLAAYDATRFTSEYPGINSGGLPGGV